jgi:hypothetical protein
VKNYLFYDTAETDKSSEYDSYITLRNSGTGVMTYDSTNKYYIYKVTNTGDSFIPIKPLENQSTNFIMEYDAYLVNSNSNIGFDIYISSTLFERIQINTSYEFIYKNINGSITDINTSESVPTAVWCHYKYILNGSNFTVIVTNSSGTVLVNKTETLDSAIINASSHKYGFDMEWNNGGTTYVKNIKAYIN